MSTGSLSPLFKERADCKICQAIAITDEEGWVGGWGCERLDLKGDPWVAREDQLRGEHPQFMSQARGSRDHLGQADPRIK